MVFAAWARVRRGSTGTMVAPTDAASRPRRETLIELFLRKRGGTPARRRKTSATDQRAAAIGQRAEGFLGRGGLQQLVVVPGRLALLRLLHLEQVARADLAAVYTDAAWAEGVVVGRHRLHAVHHLS